MIYIVEEETPNGLDKAGTRSFNRLRKLVDNFNALRNEAIQLTGSDDDIYYDNSSTFDSGPEYIGKVNLEVRDGFVVMSYETESRIGWSSRREKHLSETRYPINEGWFDIDIFKDDLSYMTKCVKRAMKYFREVNPDMTDDEINRVFDGDSAIEVTDD